MKKKLCVITGSRAEYDLLKPIIKKINSEKSFILSVIVTGSHLLKKFGFTYKKIIDDKIQIKKKINILPENDDEHAICLAISNGIKKFSLLLKKNKYDFIIVLGDRYEILSFVIAASFFNIPIIHFSGGEVTSGSIDDRIRHAITKFSKFHFVSNERYKKRVTQLGEDPKKIFNVGSTGPENIKKEKLLNKSELESQIKFKFRHQNFLVTYHPVSYEKDYGLKNFMTILKVLSKFKNTGIIFTMPNSDIKNNYFFSAIKDFAKKNKNSKYFISLGRKKYYSCIKYSDVVIGNSSSGIIEVPSLKKPTINLGRRQNGRIFARSVLNCEKITKKKLNNLIKKSLSLKVKNISKKVINPYEKKNTSGQVIKILKKITQIKDNHKVFFDFN